MGFMQEQIRYRKYERGFTLIELMATLVILALIIAIAVPAIGKLVAQADSSADKSSIALMERAGEMAYIDDLKTDDAAPKNSKLPGSITEKDVYMIPTLIEKGYLKLDDASKFNKPENYVKKVNKSGKFIYMGKGKDDGDKPSNEDVAMGSCARDFAYDPKAISSEDDYKMVMRNGYGYGAVTMDADGNYVAVGLFSSYSYADEKPGIMIDRYDKDLKLLDSGTSNPTISGDFKIYDILANKSGGYTVFDTNGVSLYDKDLNFVKMQKLSVAEDDNVPHIVQGQSGAYFVAVGEYQNGYNVIKLSENLSSVDEGLIASSTGNESMNSWSALNDFDVLSTGELVIAGTGVYDQIETGHLIKFTEDFDVVASTDKTAPHIGYGYAQIEELSNGSLAVLYKGDWSLQTAGIRMFDKNFALLESVDHPDAAYGGYQWTVNPDKWYLEADGNQVSTIASERFVTYDASLSVVKEQSVAESVLSMSMGVDSKVFVTDNGSFILSGGLGSGSSSMLIKATRPFEGEGVGKREIAPLINPTVPPSKKKYAAPGGNGRTAYDDGNPTPWLTPEAPEEENESREIEYASGYNASTKKVNPIYAGSVMLSFAGVIPDSNGNYRPKPFVVESDGTLVTLTMDEYVNMMPEDPMAMLDFPLYFLSDDFMGLEHDEYSAAPPTNAPVRVGDESSPETPGYSAPSVDPCYAGAFIVNVYDMLMYHVQEDGSLKLLGDPYQMSESELGFDAKKDVVLYLFKDGELELYPTFYNSILH